MTQLRTLSLMALALVSPLFTACQGSSQPANASSNYTTSLTAAATGASSLVTSYAPTSVSPGSVVAITVSGGVSPYTYKVVNGGGTLKANIYTVPTVTITASSTSSTVTPDVAVILVIDSVGQTATVHFDDIAALQAEVTSLETTDTINYIQIPGGTAVQRNCDLEGIQKGGEDVATLISYSYCLVLGRAATTSEISNYTPQLLGTNGSKLAPEQMLAQLIDSSEFASDFNAASMTPSNWVTFMYELLTLTTPTATQLSQYIATIGNSSMTSIKVENGSGAFATVYNNILATTAFSTANPLMVAEQTYWQNNH